MTAFDEVMAEEWTVEVRDHDPDDRGELPCVMLDVTGPGSQRWLHNVHFGYPDKPDQVARAAVAVLGKRALALIIEHEFCAEAGRATCPECGGRDYGSRKERGHEDGCEWAAIVAEAKKLRGIP